MVTSLMKHGVNVFEISPPLPPSVRSIMAESFPLLKSRVCIFGLQVCGIFGLPNENPQPARSANHETHLGSRVTLLSGPSPPCPTSEYIMSYIYNGPSPPSRMRESKMCCISGPSPQCQTSQCKRCHRPWRLMVHGLSPWEHHGCSTPRNY